jgi:hypothetical protein
MLDVDPKDLLQVATANDQQPVQALGSDRPPAGASAAVSGA